MALAGMIEQQFSRLADKGASRTASEAAARTVAAAGEKTAIASERASKAAVDAIAHDLPAGVAPADFKNVKKWLPEAISDATDGEEGVFKRAFYAKSVGNDGYLPFTALLKSEDTGFLKVTGTVHPQKGIFNFDGMGTVTMK